MVAVADRRQGEAAVLPGFEHLHRYWDPAQSRMTVKALAGEF
jgi:chemotaxis protein CheD